jgi:hypothetical protein
MTNEEKEVFAGLLKKIYAVTDEEVAGLYNEAGELTNVDSILSKDSDRIARFKKEKNDEYKRAEIKTAQKFESYLKEKYDVGDSELMGTDLIDSAFEKQSTALSEKLKAKLNPDDIEKHPVYIAKRAEFEKQIRAKEKEIEDRIAAKESEWNRKAVFDEVKNGALTELDLGYLLPENSERANALKSVFIEKLGKANFIKNEKGEIQLLDSDSKPLEDAHGKMITLKEYQEQLAGQFFDKKIASQRSNAGNRSNEGQQSNITLKDQGDFQTQMATAKTAEERAAIMSAAKATGIVK